MRIPPSWAALGLATLATGLIVGSPATADPGADRADSLEALADNPSAARASDGQAFTVRSTTKDADGTTHARIDRTYRGLEVVGGDLVVHQDASGTLEGVSQSLLQKLSLGVKPGVSSSSRSEEHTSELQSLMRIPYAVFCSKKNNTNLYILIV